MVARPPKLLDLDAYLDRNPAKLSGGQRQRVAMGRAIVREPQVFCMDEPLSNLDAKLRVQTRTQIAELQRRLGATTVYVTHDQVEAMTMGDRVAVLKLRETAAVRLPHRSTTGPPPCSSPDSSAHRDEPVHHPPHRLPASPSPAPPWTCHGPRWPNSQRNGSTR